MRRHEPSAVGLVIATCGGSETGGGVYVTASVSVAVLADASVAVTVIVFNPCCSVIPEWDHEFVPVHVPLPPALFDQLTDDIASPPDAVPPMLRVELLVA